MNKARLTGINGVKPIQPEQDSLEVQPNSKLGNKSVCPDPTDHAKMGIRQSPLPLCIAGANVNDYLLLATILDVTETNSSRKA